MTSNFYISDLGANLMNKFDAFSFTPTIKRSGRNTKLCSCSLDGHATSDGFKRSTYKTFT